MNIKVILTVPKESCRTCLYLTKRYVDCGCCQGYYEHSCNIFLVEIHDYKRCKMCEDSEVEQ